MSKANTVRTKAYKIILSTGDTISIDQDEVQKVIHSVESGSVAIFRQGVLNPSYFTGVVEDKQRRRVWIEDTKYRPEDRKAGLKALRDIFEDTSVSLPSPESPQKYDNDTNQSRELQNPDAQTDS